MQMDVRKLIDFLNYVVVAYNEALENVGLDSQLVNAQMARAFKEKAAHIIKDDFSLNIEGNDVQSIVKSFIERIKATGICQRTELVNISDSNLTIRMGDSILNQADKILLRDKPTGYIPPSPIISMLSAFLEEGAKKSCSIEKYEFIPEENSSQFTIKLEQ